MHQKFKGLRTFLKDLKEVFVSTDEVTELMDKMIPKDRRSLI